MAQLTGSGPGHGTNYAMVSDDERLHTTSFPEASHDLNLGTVYQAGSYFQDLALDTSGAIFICVGSIDLHIAIDARTDGDCILDFYENAEVTHSGVSLPIFNRNRHSSHAGSTLSSTAWINPVISSIGGLIHTAMFLGGSGTATKFVSAEVDIAPGNGEWILETGSCYYLRFSNICGRNMNADFNLVLHEHRH